MKRKRGWLISGISFVFLAGLLFLFLEQRGAPFEFGKAKQTFDLKDVNTAYVGHIQVDYKAKEATGTWEVAAKNDTGKNQNVIYFNLYPNHYKDLSKLKGPVWAQVLGPHPKAGGTTITEVTVNNQDVKASVNGMILKVPLKHWKKNEVVQIGMKVDLKVPHDLSTLTYDDHSILFGNWLPTRVVYNKGSGWAFHSFYPNGDSFYTAVANYDLVVSVPKNNQLASSGYDEPSVVNGDTRTYTIQAHKMRDFAMVVMDQTYEPYTTHKNGITFRTWHYKSDSKAGYSILHQIGVDSLNYYSHLWGPYPYKQYDMVRTGGYFGGMEYPGLVYIQGQAYTSGDYYNGLLDVAHETAHQWWYAMVGDDEVQNPWLDESLAQYSTYRALDKYYTAYSHTFLDFEKKYAGNSGPFEKENIFISSPLSQFQTGTDYYDLVYAKGPLMFYNLEKAVGKAKMDQVLHNLYKDYKFKIATPQDYIDEFAKVLGPGAQDYFNSWLHGGHAAFKSAN